MRPYDEAGRSSLRGPSSSRFGSELAVLLDAPEDEIAPLAGDRIAQGVSRVRDGDLQIEPGYDGVYGSVTIWPQR